ncbi:unnamed protein product (macronuclear) [Paramecium tetraurelia]|uniref:Uncharacterized protein n=1 Tax=Paramecium tetraurelia TaxID=5888 RepID=A0D051_PARTE|nr:uncharacterized protein GSPATT00011970001 [Paramecium tetraurelia]CAK76418.1 unnamed protein product [Paramecium tetraurelia]|eukprot:XP_001443815.1 hypothetical protein (macronuclear) [Paramecium tetraurelia strain d4-2]
MENEFYSYYLGSAYGTFVIKAWIPTNLFHKLNPYDELKFGQSLRVYILRFQNFEKQIKQKRIRQCCQNQNDTKVQSTQVNLIIGSTQTTNSSVILQLRNQREQKSQKNILNEKLKRKFKVKWRVQEILYYYDQDRYKKQTFTSEILGDVKQKRMNYVYITKFQ